MKVLNIKLFSRSQRKINKFVYLLFKNALNLSLAKKHVKKKKETKILTILKSPHVHKKAQEQFELRTFINQFILFSVKNIKFLVALKKLKSSLFPEIKIKVKFLAVNKRIRKAIKKTFSPENSKAPALTKQPFKYKVRRKKVKIFCQSIKILDTCGETYYMY